MVRVVVLVIAVGLAGCARPSEPSATNLNVAIEREPGVLPDVSPSSSSPGFEYPADLGGEAVVKAVAPDRPALTAIRTIPAPKPRVLSAPLLDPDATVAVSYRLARVLAATPEPHATIAPLPPRELVPIALGRGADGIPSPPRFPVAAGLTTRARDVKFPPAMPILGRPRDDRVSIDDPTAELGNTSIVAPTVKPPVAPAAFRKVSLPDPFELGEEVRAALPRALAPGLSPVVVNPERKR
jgi:hypothetical protein